MHQIYLHRQVFVGDVILLKDPEKSDDLIIRRLAALEGYEMVSSDEKDEPFVLEKDQCWVLADNQALKPKVCMLFMLVIITCNSVRWRCTKIYSILLCKREMLLCPH